MQVLLLVRRLRHQRRPTPAHADVADVDAPPKRKVARRVAGGLAWLRRLPLFVKPAPSMKRRHGVAVDEDGAVKRATAVRAVVQRGEVTGGQACALAV